MTDIKDKCSLVTILRKLEGHCIGQSNHSKQWDNKNMNSPYKHPIQNYKTYER